MNTPFAAPGFADYRGSRHGAPEAGSPSAVHPHPPYPAGPMPTGLRDGPRPLPPLRPHQIELLQRTVARDCLRAEFDLFIATAHNHGLDPFRKQIAPLILNPNDPARRQLVVPVTIHGQRIVAQRCGNYRAASEPTDFVIEETLRSPTKPAGHSARPRAPVAARSWRYVVPHRRGSLLGRVRPSHRCFGGGRGDRRIAEDRRQKTRSRQPLGAYAASDDRQMRHQPGAAGGLARAVWWIVPAGRVRPPHRR